MTGNVDMMNDDAFEQGRVALPKQMNFRNFQKIYVADFGSLYRAFFGRFTEKVCNTPFQI